MGELCSTDYFSDDSEAYFIAVGNRLASDLGTVARSLLKSDELFEKIYTDALSNTVAANALNLERQGLVQRAVDLELVVSHEFRKLFRIDKSQAGQNLAEALHDHARQQRKTVHPDLGEDEEFAKQFNRLYDLTKPSEDMPHGHIGRQLLAELFERYSDKVQSTTDRLWLARGFEVYSMRDMAYEQVGYEDLAAVHIFAVSYPREQLRFLRDAHLISSVLTNTVDDQPSEILAALTEAYQPDSKPFKSVMLYPLPTAFEDAIGRMGEELDIALRDLEGGGSVSNAVALISLQEHIENLAEDKAKILELQ